MKISDALIEIRKMKEQIGRLYSIRSDNFKVFIPKDKTLDDVKLNPKAFNVVPFEEITERIEKLEGEITILRERILRTNIGTQVVIGEGKDAKPRSLAMLKLEIDDYKSRLAQLMNLRSLRSHGRMFGSRKAVSTEDEEKEVSQLSDIDLEDMITDLENHKTKLQGLLDNKNAGTELLGK